MTMINPSPFSDVSLGVLALVLTKDVYEGAIISSGTLKMRLSEMMRVWINMTDFDFGQARKFHCKRNMEKCANASFV